MDDIDFGAYLARIRERNGFKSQRSLALEANISPATLSRIESGIQRPTPETLKALSVFFRDVSYEDLLRMAGYLNDTSQEDDSREAEPDEDEIPNEIHSWLRSDPDLTEDEREELEEDVKSYYAFRKRRIMEERKRNRE